MNDRDILFLLKPGFEENGERWFCPYCAQLAGFLEYFPAARATLDVREVDFARPRREIVELIGEEWQSCPVLVLAADSRVPEELEGDVVTSRGRRAISATKAILRYLAVSRGLPLPH